jgi:penicillin-binding protein 1A
MGVTSPLSNVVSLPLGVNEITPLEMAGAYASIANEGTYNKPYFVDKITDAAGNVIYQHEAAPERVMSTQSARQELVALQAVVSGGTATRARLADRPVAGKTGTTDLHGDAWFIGSIPQLTTAVWMGNPESVVPMTSVGGINVFGGTFPALVWHNFMVAATEDLPVQQFAPPDPLPKGTNVTLPDDKEDKRTSDSRPFVPRTSPGSTPGSTPDTGVTQETPPGFTFPPRTGDTTPPEPN